MENGGQTNKLVEEINISSTNNYFTNSNISKDKQLQELPMLITI